VLLCPFLRVIEAAVYDNRPAPSGAHTIHVDILFTFLLNPFLDLRVVLLYWLADCAVKTQPLATAPVRKTSHEL